MTLSLTGMVISLGAISCADPLRHPWILAGSLLFLSASMGCWYLVGVDYELESLEEGSYGVGSAWVLTGYRLGLLCAGGVGLCLALVWSWAWMFRTLASLLLIGSLTFLLQPEPFRSASVLEERRRRLRRYDSSLQAFWRETLWQPSQLFFKRSDWQMIVLMLLAFKLGDQLLESMTGPFYLSVGFNKGELAAAAKFWGMGATVVGAFVGGSLLKGKPPFQWLAQMGLLHASTLFCYYWMTLQGKSHLALYVTVALENVTSGMAITAFIAFLWRICNPQCAAVQYALFWSLFSLKGDLLRCLGGLLAARCNWSFFFLTVALFSFMTSFLVLWIQKRQAASAENLLAIAESVSTGTG